jgi:putative FmdB family regulatory protein
MPLYEYQCASCGSVFEKMQKFADEPLKVHEDCGGAVRRLLTAPALQFKGTGWYITDYGRGGSKSKDSNGAKQAGSETKTESTAKPDSSASATTSTSGKSEKSSK